MSMLIFIYMVILPEEQTFEAREALKKQFSFGSGGNLNRKIISSFTIILFCTFH